MGKRSDFERRERDFYPTPFKAVLPLTKHLRNELCFTFFEPCAGAGDLVDHLEKFGLHCLGATDIHPMRADVAEVDVHSINETYADCFITNPPWPSGPSSKGEPTVSMIRHLSDIAPSWFLLSADFIGNGYFRSVSDRCRKIVSVGRVKWIPNSKHSGKDNAAWYKFHDPRENDPPRFFGV